MVILRFIRHRRIISQLLWEMACCHEGRVIEAVRLLGGDSTLGRLAQEAARDVHKERVGDVGYKRAPAIRHPDKLHHSTRRTRTPIWSWIW